MTDLSDVIPSLVRIRQHAGLTQADIADRMGISQPQVSELETGTHEPLLSTLQKYHRAVTGRALELRVTRTVRTGWFSGGGPEPTPKRVDFAISS